MQGTGWARKNLNPDILIRSEVKFQESKPGFCELDKCPQEVRKPQENFTRDPHATTNLIHNCARRLEETIIKCGFYAHRAQNLAEGTEYIYISVQGNNGPSA